MDKIYIKLIPNADKQPGDNRPSWVAPINPKSPQGKTWRIGQRLATLGTTKLLLMIIMRMAHQQED